MTWVAVGVGGAALVGGIYASNQASNAASNASAAQTAASQAGIAEQQSQFAAMQKLLAPYVTAGNGSLSAQQDLLGMNGNDAQAKAISGVQSSPIYTSALAAGNRNILSNASATGGLRGGNTQAALGQFAPTLLSSVIQQQYGNLAGITSQGENAAAGVGNAGIQTGNSITGLLQQQGASQAGNALAQGSANTGYASAVTNALGLYGALGGFKTTQPVPAVTSGSNPSGYNGTMNNPSAYVGGPF
jgi:hypothetical protein